MYLNLYKGVSHVLVRAKEEVFTRSNPIRDWSKCSTVGWYFGIGLVVVRFLIFVTVCFLLVDFWEW